jgi:hypothetical protein
MTILQGDDFAVRRLHSVAEVHEAPSGAEIRSSREDGFTAESKSGDESRRGAAGHHGPAEPMRRNSREYAANARARACREVGPAVAAGLRPPPLEGGAVQFLSLDNNSVTPV